MFCTTCGAKLSDDAKFCTACGAKIAAPAAQPAAAPAAETPAAAPAAAPVAETPAAAPAASAPVAETTAAAPVFEASVAEPVPEAPAAPADPIPAAAPTVEAPAPAAAPAPETPAPQQYSAPVAPPPSYTTVAEAPYHPNPVVSAVKRAFTSPTFLFAALAYTLMVVANLLTVFGLDTGSSLDSFLYAVDASEAVGVMKAYFSFMKVLSVIAMTPVFLILAGLWTAYAQAHKKNGLGTAGFTMVKASMVIRLVFQFITLGLVTIVLLVAMDEVSDLTYGMSGMGMDVPDTSGYFLGMILGFVLVMAPTIIYEFCVLSSIKSIKKTITTGVYSKKGFGATVVFNYIFVGLNVISLLLLFSLESLLQSIVSAAMSGVGEMAEAMMVGELFSELFSLSPWVYVAQLAMIAALILFSVNLSKYKNGMLYQEQNNTL